jgi:polysaccharide export outer membrane protein
VVGERGAPIDVFDSVAPSLNAFDPVSDRALRRELEALEDDGELKRFGLNIFDRDISTFSPVDDLPVPANYALGPGDTVNVLLYGNEQDELLLEVGRDGSLLFPRLGMINVAGLTFAELKEVIGIRVKSQFVGTSAIVSIGALRSINVFLAGEVIAPGNYSVSGLSTVTQVLYAAGGVTDIGTMRNIQVKREGKVIVTFDLYDLLLRGDTSNDIRLSSGDTVFVPVMNSIVAADGEVRRAALYETVVGDTVGSLLRMAGGVSAQGYVRSASISRYAVGESGRSRIALNLIEKADLDRPIFDGDELEVGRVKEDIRRQVLVRGAVARPGGYAWREGLRISDLLGSVDDDLLSETDLNTGLVVRRTGLGLEVEVLGLDLLNAIRQPGADADLVLNSRDEVLVFSLPYFNDSYKKLREGIDTPDKAERKSKPKEREEQDTEEASEEGESDSEKDNSYAALTEDPVEEEGIEDRQALIEEVVFRLQAQAKTPSETNLVAVSGDVRLPGTYPLLQGGEMAELIELAGGFEASAYLDRAEVTRLSFLEDGSAKLRTIPIPLADVLDGSNKFKLEPRDQVQIRRIPNWSYGDAVSIAGAIVSPGDYPIAPGEKLSSILRRSGGLSEVAFAEGAVLIKASARKREQDQIRKLVASIQRSEISKNRTRESGESSNATIEDRDELIELLMGSDVGGRVVIDLPGILAGDPNADIQLQAGDSLFVPEFSNTVSVIGEVREPGTFRFQSDRTINDYLEYAAGASTRALTKAVYVVRANGGVERIEGKKQLFRFSESKTLGVRPGDTIVVPVNEDYQPTLTKYREVSTVVFQSMASLFPLLAL